MNAIHKIHVLILMERPVLGAQELFTFRLAKALDKSLFNVTIGYVGEGPLLTEFSHSNTSTIPSGGVAAPEELSLLKEAVGVTPETTDSSLAVLGSDETLAFLAELRS